MLLFLERHGFKEFYRFQRGKMFPFALWKKQIIASTRSNIGQDLLSELQQWKSK